MTPVTAGTNGSISLSNTDEAADENIGPNNDGDTGAY